LSIPPGYYSEYTYNSKRINNEQKPVIVQQAGDTFLKITMTPGRNFSYPCKISLRNKSIQSVPAVRGINNGGSFV
jgi:hypothetical protein